MLELTLLKLFCNRDKYENYSSYIDPKSLTIEASILFQDFGQYYETFPNDAEIDLTSFTTWFYQTCHPDMTSDMKELYRTVFTRLNETSVDTKPELIQEIIQSLDKQRYSDLLVSKIQTKEWDPDELVSLVEEYKGSVAAADHDDFEPNDPDSFLTVLNKEHGLKWRLHSLQNTLGSLVPGEFGVIAAGKDTGKSAFLVSEVVNFASQLTEGTILWFTTEQPPKKVFTRIYGAVLQCPPEQLSKVQSNLKQEYTNFMHGDFNRIRIFDATAYTTSAIATKIKKYKPKLVVIDMLDHIKFKGGSEKNDWRYLQQLYHAIRMLARECPILGTSQVDAQTSGVYGPLCKPPHVPGEKWCIKYIDFKMLEGSKIGKQGATDFIITIGKDDKKPNTRYIHVPTSKTGKTVQSEASFNIETAIYSDFKF